MGVYISGIDMPKENEILQIRIYDDGKVSRVYDIKCQQIGTAIETVQRGGRSMSRCEYCQYRNSWECGDGWNRRSNDTICNDFKLDYDTLTNRQKRTIQEILMREDGGE